MPRASRTGILLLILLAGSLSVVPAQDACIFCHAEQSSSAFICTKCGRLFNIASLDSSSRFWGDAFYIYRLPSITSRPELVAEVGPEGVIRETAQFDLGDRYEYLLTNKGVEITGTVHAFNSRGVEYLATFEDHQDESGRLTLRTLHAELRTKPRRYLYRTIEYGYDGEQMDSAEVSTWIYGKANDWEKRPAEWIRHRRVNVRLEYDDGVLARVHALREKGTRDLRGNADYEATEGFSEPVLVRNGIVIGFGTPEPMEEQE